MGSEVRKCEKCRDDKPCIQRRDGSWACGPCLKDEWMSVKSVMVQRSQAMHLGHRVRKAKHGVNA